MNREAFAKVFYGDGPVPPPWATDCPVKFEVWWAYAQRTQPSDSVDLILALGEQHNIGEVLNYVRDFNVPGVPRSNRRPVLSGAYIAVELAFDELIAIVLPLTSLGRKIGTARQVVGAGDPVNILTPIINGDDFVIPSTSTEAMTDWEGAQLTYRTVERREHLRWFLRVIDAVLRAQLAVPGVQDPSTPVPQAAAVWEKLQRVSQTQATLPRIDDAPQTIDRRARHPVRTVTLNRDVVNAVTQSRMTIKADAAEQVFGIDCSEIGWAIVDSGIDATHPAFARPFVPGAPMPPMSTRVVATYDLTLARDAISPDMNQAIIDWAAVIPHIVVPHEPNRYRIPVDPHGTHVAGVLGADWTDGPTIIRGVAPTIRLYDFRVLGPGPGKEFQVIAALQLIRFLNEQAGTRLIHGVNLSLSLRHDLANYSCGWTPICEECNRLVRSGVVVVAAAGNAGFEGGDFATGYGYNTVSITDPGNADSVITVGSTHRSNPHRHGVSYFSSRGPTADGRRKPDLLAPGEDIDGPIPGAGLAAMHGTSQAAPHVSGAAALLMARHRELRGQPERIKEVLCSTATDLGREHWFQGHGLVDVLRAMQSI
jgi:Subtilase family